MDNKALQEIIKQGGSVMFRGRNITKLEEVPTDEELLDAELDYRFSKILPHLRKYVESIASLKELGIIFDTGTVNIPNPGVKPPVEPEIEPQLLVPDLTKGFGRMIAEDPRDNNYLLKKKALSGIDYRYYVAPKALDQKDTSECVAYAGQMLLVAGTVKNEFYKTPYKLYKECQQVDEWEGDNYEGTSVRALMKVLQREGYIKEYRWATTVEPLVSHVLTTSPVIVGTNWYNSMFYPDFITGFVTIRGISGIAGGHAYMIKGANRKKLCPDGSRGAFRCINSWGLEWGDKGMFWVSFKDMNRLIRENGEAVAPTELKVIIEAEK